MSELGELERTVLTYLFGQELPLDDPFVKHALLVAFHVEVTDLPPVARAVAVRTLVASIVDRGLGAAPMGWTTYEQDGRTAIGVLVLNHEQTKEAA